VADPPGRPDERFVELFSKDGDRPASGVYVALYEQGFLEVDDVERAHAFLRDLSRARASAAATPARVLAADSAGRVVRVYPNPVAVDVGASGRGEVGILVMTKDDIPLLSRWLIYHGHVFGFENLYVLDGSTGAQKEYLDRVNKYFPITVRHSLTDLNGIAKEIVAWLLEIKDRYEWIMKVDTDEFVSYAPGCKLDLSFTSLHLPNSTAADLATLEFLFVAEAAESGSPVDVQRARGGAGSRHKQIYSGPRFQSRHFNLGSHAQIPGSQVSPGLAVVHYHARTFDGLVRMATQAVVSHGFINATDDSAIMIKKLTKLDRRPQCGFVSCHKLWIVLDALKDYDKARNAYYEQFAGSQYKAILHEFANYHHEIFPMYPQLAPTRRRS
jgi:hypothetical protein